jgi:acetyl esterase/lipase
MLRACILLLFVLTKAGAQSKQIDSSSAFSKETFVYKSVYDTVIKADVYKLPGQERRPVIIWIHGGALIFGSRGMLPPDERNEFLKAGYVLVAIDYRLAPETKLTEILKDVDDAYKWVCDKGPTLFHADPQHVAVIGQSAGAYLALMAGIRCRPTPQAIVSFYGYGNISGDWYSRPSMYFLRRPRVTKEVALAGLSKRALSESPIRPREDFYVYCRQNGLWPTEVAGIHPRVEPQKLRAFNPEDLVTHAYPPTLLLQGDQDTDVPFEMSLRMDNVLARQGVQHRLYRMVGFDHLFDVFPDGLPPKGNSIGLQNPKVAEAFRAVLSFLAKYMRTS